jgi:hypothetical protein
MWTAVLYFGFGLALDPIRLGLVGVVLSRQRPIPNLIAFWLGGMVAGVGVGLAALVLFRDVAMSAMQHLADATNALRSEVSILAGGGLQITLGTVVLVTLAVIIARQRFRAGADIGATVHPVPLGPPNVFARMAAFSQDLLGRGVWPAFLVGLGSATPPVECVMVLTIIMASGAEVATQMVALVVFTFLVLALVEIPLLTYLLMPRKTEAVMLRLNAWLGIHRRRIFQSMLAVTGLVLLAKGLTGI